MNFLRWLWADRGLMVKSMNSRTGYGMNAKLDGKKAQEAWQWVWFYSGPEGSKIRATFGALPAYKVDLGDADIMLKKLNAFLRFDSGRLCN